MAAVDVITRQRLETKNRIALMLLDSNFEIALKEFIVHRDDLFPPSQYGKAVIQKLFDNSVRCHHGYYTKSVSSKSAAHQSAAFLQHTEQTCA